MDTEYECPDCGTLHYAPTPVKCDCRASALREAGIDPTTFKDLPDYKPAYPRAIGQCLTDPDQQA